MSARDKSSGKKRQQNTTVASIATKIYALKWWTGTVTLSCGHEFCGSGTVSIKKGDSWSCDRCDELEASKRSRHRANGVVVGEIPSAVLREIPVIRQRQIKEIAAVLGVDVRTAQRCATSPSMVSDQLYYRYLLMNMDANVQKWAVGNVNQ